MKKMLKRSALTGATIALLAAAALQVIEPSGARAQEGPDDECSGTGALCGLEATYTCKFWIFMCDVDVEFLFYGDGSDNN